MVKKSIYPSVYCMERNFGLYFSYVVSSLCGMIKVANTYKDYSAFEIPLFSRLVFLSCFIIFFIGVFGFLKKKNSRFYIEINKNGFLVRDLFFKNKFLWMKVNSISFDNNKPDILRVDFLNQREKLINLRQYDHSEKLKMEIRESYTEFVKNRNNRKL